MAQPADTDIPVDLGKYRGKKVVRTTAKLTNAGDGLSPALELSPVIYDPGKLVTIVIRTRVAKHTHIDLEDGTLELQQVFSAGTMAVVDDDLVADVLNEQERREQERRDHERGQAALDGMDAGTGRPSLSALK